MTTKGKVIIVTGASGGIGLATAQLLAKQGAKVALVARTITKLQILSTKLKGSYACPADMSDAVQIRKMVKDVFKHYGRIDGLINNAGRGYDSLIEKSDPKNIEAIFQLDFMGPLIAMQEVIPLMKQQGAGSIINISSGTALMHLPNMGAYASIKAALAHISLTAREELKKDNISISVVYPYITDTDFETNTIKQTDAVFWDDSDRQRVPPPADTAEHVASIITNCWKNGQAEVFAHDWMKPKA